MTRKTNKTNEEIIKEFKKIFSIDPFDRGLKSMKKSQSDMLAPLPLSDAVKFIKESLRAKDLQCRQEKVELVESVPLSFQYKENKDDSGCVLVFDKIYILHARDLLEWKQNNLKRLKS